MCCITGLKVRKLLVASHIKPWSADKENRLNPRNGLCLNALHDKAFDTGLITVTPDFRVKVSNVISDLVQNDTLKKFFLDYHDKSIIIPERFTPNPVFLEYHSQEIYIH
jgi:putative restriction endonuclease